MASPDVEKAIFNQFVALQPNFAGKAVTCSPGANPPDFLCVDEHGARIGIELSEWLHEDQIANEKPQYQREGQFLEVIDSRNEPPPANMRSIWFFEQDGVWLKKQDGDLFRAQLFTFVRDLDARWLSLEDHDDPQGVVVDDFAGYPMLEKYVSFLLCWPAHAHRAVEGTEWITFMAHGGAYSPDTAVKALELRLLAKVAKYETLKVGQNLQELYLLLYYDQGWLYNTPFDAPGFGFNEIAHHLANIAATAHGEFDKIFLFIPANKQVAMVYPAA